MKLKSPFLHLKNQATLQGTIAFNNKVFPYLFFKGVYSNSWVFLFDTEGGMTLTNCVDKVAALAYKDIRRRDPQYPEYNQIQWIQQDSDNAFFQVDFKETSEIIPSTQTTRITTFLEPSWTSINSQFWLVYPFFAPDELIDLGVK